MIFLICNHCDFRCLRHMRRDVSRSSSRVHEDLGPPARQNPPYVHQRHHHSHTDQPVDPTDRLAGSASPDPPGGLAGLPSTSHVGGFASASAKWTYRETVSARPVRAGPVIVACHPMCVLGVLAFLSGSVDPSTSQRRGYATVGG